MSTNKSFSTETSERYARALYEVGKDSNEVDKIETDVKIFQSLFDSNFEIKNFIQNPTHVIETQNKVLDILSEKLGFTKNLKNFFFLLIKKRRMFFVKKITDNFLKLCSKNRGEIKASLITSKALSSNELENISAELSSSMNSTIKFDHKVDQSLIGGLKLQLGSFMIDTSIKNKLKKYKQRMLEN
jgi:F-type H+-transporting ATPase subunit delta